MRYFRVKIHKTTKFSTEFFVRAKNEKSARKLAKLQKEKLAEEHWDLDKSTIAKIETEDLGDASELGET